MPRLIMMCGLPGAGKTTQARQLARVLPAVRLCPDEWLVRLGFDLFDGPARERVERALWELAQDLLGHGVSVILENGFWSRTEREEKRVAARELGVAVELHYLAAPLDELYRRLRGRGGDPAVRITWELLQGYAGVFEPPDMVELTLFDPPTPASPDEIT